MTGFMRGDEDRNNAMSMGKTLHQTLERKDYILWLKLTKYPKLKNVYFYDISQLRLSKIVNFEKIMCCHFITFNHLSLI